MRRFPVLVILLVAALWTADLTPASATASDVGAITGTVTDASGHPLAGARVSTSLAWSFDPGGSATTDADGNYRIDDLATGDYYVCVSAQDATGGTSTTGYLDGCIGGGIAQDSLGSVHPYGPAPHTVVAVASGAAVVVPDVDLKPAGQLTGTLTNVSGDPIPAVRVYGWSEDANGIDITATDVTDADGRYLLSVDNDNGSANRVYHGSRLPLGQYRLSFKAPTTAYADFDHPTVIHVAGGSPTLIDHTLSVAGSIGGKVTDAEGTALADVIVDLRRAGGQTLTTSTAADGTYTFLRLPEADYTVCFRSNSLTAGSSQAGYLDSCSGGSSPNAPATVSLGVAQDRTDVGGMLAGASIIEGTVRNEAAQPIFGVRVSVRGEDGREYDSGFSNNQGTYGVLKLPAGQYTVCFSPSSTESAIYQGECWEDLPIDSDGNAVTTTAGNRSTVDVVLALRPPADTTSPTISLNSPSKLFGNDRVVDVTYRAADAQGAVLDHDVRYRVATWNGTFGAWVYRPSWQHRASASAALTGRAGRTYCFSARARDVEGNVSAWTPEKCRVVALDDRALKATPAWRRTHRAGSYAGTETRTATRGATLKLGGASSAHVAVMFTACSRCGKVGVYVGSKLVATVNTYSATTRLKRLKIAPGYALRNATITLKVLQRRTVIVDGLSVTRR